MIETEINSEQAFLGSCLVSGEALNFAFYHVDEEYFIDPQNRRLYEVLRRLYKVGTAVDAVTVTGSLTASDKKKLSSEYVFDLVEKIPTALHYRHHANLMKKHYVTSTLVQRYAKATEDPTDIENQKEIRKLWDQLNGESTSVIDAKEATLRYTDALEARKSGRHDRVMSNFHKFDSLIGGFYRGNMIIVGARTSVGKTSFLLNMAVSFLKQKIKVLFVSAEMTWDELLDRVVSSEGGVFVSKLRRGDINKAEYKNVSGTLADISEMPLYCIEGGRMNMARVRLAVEIVKPDAIFVDFIQRFTPPNPNQNRAAFFSDLANELKALAMEKKIVMVAASQMNREIEKAEKRRDPQLSDLKESGGIEEAADVAILMQAEKEEDTMMPERKVTMHVKKNRHGPTGEIEFVFEKRNTRFSEAQVEATYEERNPTGND